MVELLSDNIKNQVREVFKGLENPVEILFFGDKKNCQYCADTRQLLDEVAGLSDLLGLTVYDLNDNDVAARQYKIDKAPGFTILAKVGENLVDYGIRFFGIPSGHEFTSLVNSLLLVSSRNAHLSPETLDYLKDLAQPVHLQVFVTPT